MLHKNKYWLERLGVGLSFACAVHCIISPLFIAFLPFVSSAMNNNHTFEVVLLSSSFLIVGITNLVGFIRHHKQYAPLIFMVLGFSLILSGHLSHTYWLELSASIFGGISIAYSILLNAKATRANRASACCKLEHK